MVDRPNPYSLQPNFIPTVSPQQLPPHLQQSQMQLPDITSKANADFMRTMSMLQSQHRERTGTEMQPAQFKHVSVDFCTHSTFSSGIIRSAHLLCAICHPSASQRNVMRLYPCHETLGSIMHRSILPLIYAAYLTPRFTASPDVSKSNRCSAPTNGRAASFWDGSPWSTLALPRAT